MVQSNLFCLLGRNVDFQRAFGNLSSFSPAMEVIPTETGWADTLPLHQATMVSAYSSVINSPTVMASPLPTRYSTAPTMSPPIIPEVGIDLSGDNWTPEGAETLPGGTYASYTHTPLTAGEALTLVLNGPSPPHHRRNRQHHRHPQPNQRTHHRQHRSNPCPRRRRLPQSAPWQNPALPNDRNALLQALAQLDDAYEDHQITPHQYEKATHKSKQINIPMAG